jgi:hypothetical protein
MPDDSGGGGFGDPTGGNPGGSSGQFTDPTGGGGDQTGGGWWNSFLGWLSGGNQNQQGGGGGGGVPVGTAGKIGTGATALDTAKFIAALIQSQHKGQFQNVPLSPEQQALFNFSFSRLAGSPNPAHDLYPYTLQRAYTSPSFDMNAAMQGRPSYSPGTPPDMATLMAMINSNNSALNPTTASTSTDSSFTGDKGAGLVGLHGARGGIAK